MKDSTAKRGHGDKSSRKQEVAIAALISHGTLGASAAASGISESTLRRWLKEPTFQASYADAKRQLLEATINKLRYLGCDAVGVLHEVAVNGKSPASSRVSAGRAIVEVMLRAVEVQDLAERLDRLEANIGKD